MRVLAAAFLLAALLPGAARAGGSETSMRCSGGIVSVGDPTIDLLGKCGVPALREIRSADTFVAVTTVTRTIGRSAVLVSERWTYDFGPSQFVMFATVEGGRVVRMERGNYGYERREEPVAFPRAACDWTSLHVGDAKIDLLARCGEPALVELSRDAVVEGGPGTLHGMSALSRTALRDVEVWTYDFGPQSFVRFVFLDQGVVVRIETGGRGYARN